MISLGLVEISLPHTIPFLGQKIGFWINLFFILFYFYFLHRGTFHIFPLHNVHVGKRAPSDTVSHYMLTLLVLFVAVPAYSQVT